VPLRDSEALLTQVSATTSKQDSLQAFPKKRKRKGEELKVQWLMKIVPASGAHITNLWIDHPVHGSKANSIVFIKVE